MDRSTLYADGYRRGHGHPCPEGMPQTFISVIRWNAGRGEVWRAVCRVWSATHGIYHSGEFSQNFHATFEQAEREALAWAQAESRQYIKEA